MRMRCVGWASYIDEHPGSAPDAHRASRLESLLCVQGLTNNVFI